jgi:phosphoribosylformimino-5-aminoimidazole carboxamide ribotide isomerase
VDLDAARSGEPENGAAVRAIIDAVGAAASVEVAGGLRTAEAVDRLLQLGAARVVVGTAALREPAFAGRIVATHGAESVAAAIDVRDGQAVGQGWTANTSGLPAHEAIERLAAEGIETFEVTAIERDGLLEGPDLDLLSGVVDLGRGRIIASGGISTLDDLAATRASGCAGAIVGRALYEGRLDLKLAIEAVREHDGPRMAGHSMSALDFGRSPRDRENTDGNGAG